MTTLCIGPLLIFLGGIFVGVLLNGNGRSTEGGCQQGEQPDTPRPAPPHCGGAPKKGSQNG